MRETSKPGCRVVLSPRAIKRGIHPSLKKPVRGFFKGWIGFDTRYVKILRDGIKTVDTYHPDFWEEDLMASILFTQEKLEELKKLYEPLKEQPDAVFEFEGHQLLVSYAKYLIADVERTLMDLGDKLDKSGKF